MKRPTKKRKVLQMPHRRFALPPDMQARYGELAVGAEFRRRFPHTYGAIAEGGLSAEIRGEIEPVLSAAVAASLGQRMLGELADSAEDDPGVPA